MTTQSSRVDSFSDKVIKETLALSPTTSSTKNDGYMKTISDMRRDRTEEMTILTEEESKIPNDEKGSELPEVRLGELSPPWGW